MGRATEGDFEKVRVSKASAQRHTWQTMAVQNKKELVRVLLFNGVTSMLKEL